MKNLKKTILINFILLSLLIVLNLSFFVSYYNVFAEDTTILDETTATVKIISNKETTYYDSFGDAITNANNSSMVILKDTSLCTFRNIICSIDLNGKTLSGKIQISYSDLTILDSVDSGKITDSQTFYSSNLIIKSAGIIENFVLTDRSTASVLDGTINKINANGKSLNICGGEINNLCINTYSVHLSGGTINYFSFVGIAENFDMLDEGYIYTNKEDNSPIKTKDMTPSTQVTIKECTHPTFTDSVCDYCNFVCEYNGHYNKNGVCEICNYTCPHLELNENNICLKCNLQIEANIKNTSNSINYIKLEDAISAIIDNDTLTLCNNVKLKQSLEINTPCTIDLSGYSLDGYYTNLENKITVVDSKGNGFMAVSSSGSSAQIELKGAETTVFSIMTNGTKLKFYSGRIGLITIYNGTIDNILPSGYIFIKHEEGSAKKLTKQDTNTGSFYVDNCYLTCEACTHNAVDSDLNCTYCGSELTQEQILHALVNELQTTKDELSQAISKKEDITSINEKVKTLNDTISNTETICKAYGDKKDTQLKQELKDLIDNAKQEAISSSDTALELAKNNLLNILNNKIDAEIYNAKVGELTNAISNAEVASKSYADSKDLALKEELINKIEESKLTLQNVNNEILERLSKAETEIDNNTNNINSLKITLIILSVLFAITLSVGFILMYLYIKKYNKK